MNDVTALFPGQTTDRHTSKRGWRARTFYVSEQMTRAAHRLSEAEEARTGRQVGAGQIVDRAMRRYVAELLTPDELAALLSGSSND